MEPISIIMLPPDIIFVISKYLKKEQKIYNGYLWNSIHVSYPIWNLYATCKSFDWLNKFEYLCVEASKLNEYKIISRDISGKSNKFTYQILNNCLIGYYGSGSPKTGYNYSKWHFDGINLCRLTPGSTYIDYEFNGSYFLWDSNRKTKCIRFHKGSCGKIDCPLCTQLDAIQQTIFENDYDVANICKNIHDYSDGFILIREPKPILNFKFDYNRFNHKFIY